MPEQIPRLGDRVSVMFDGKIVAIFTAPDEEVLCSINVTTKKGSIMTTVVRLDDIVQSIREGGKNAGD